MFFENDKSKVNTKFNINKFVVGSSNRARASIGGKITDIEDDDIRRNEKELLNNIRKIEVAYSKSDNLLDMVYKEVRAKRKELRGRFKDLQADPLNESAFHKIDVDLLLGEIKIAKTKNDISNDRFNQIRNERKLTKDLNKIIGDNNPTPIKEAEVTQANSPLGLVRPNNNTILRKGSINTSAVTSPKSFFKQNPIKASVAEPVVSAEEPVSSVLGETVTVPSVEEIVKKRNWDGTPIAMAGSNEVSDEVLGRLRDKEKLFKESKSSQGISYERSVNSIINKSKNLEKAIFVNENTGEFYAREFEVIDGEKVITPNENHFSVTHLGSLEFNTKTKTVKPQYSDDFIKYHLVEDDDERPEYYNSEWSQVHLEKYKIPNETLSLL